METKNRNAIQLKVNLLYREVFGNDFCKALTLEFQITALALLLVFVVMNDA